MAAYTGAAVAVVSWLRNHYQWGNSWVPSAGAVVDTAVDASAAYIAGAAAAVDYMAFCCTGCTGSPLQPQLRHWQPPRLPQPLQPHVLLRGNPFGFSADHDARKGNAAARVVVARVMPMAAHLRAVHYFHCRGVLSERRTGHACLAVREAAAVVVSVAIGGSCSVAVAFQKGTACLRGQTAEEQVAKIAGSVAAVACCRCHVDGDAHWYCAMTAAAVCSYSSPWRASTIYMSTAYKPGVAIVDVSSAHFSWRNCGFRIMGRTAPSDNISPSPVELQN